MARVQRIAFRLAVLAGICMLSSAALAQQPANSLTVTKLADNVYFAAGGGGNSGIIIGNAGVIVVDAKINEQRRPAVAGRNCQAHLEAGDPCNRNSQRWGPCERRRVVSRGHDHHRAREQQARAGSRSQGRRQHTPGGPPSYPGGSRRQSQGSEGIPNASGRPVPAAALGPRAHQRRPGGLPARPGHCVHRRHHCHQPSGSRSSTWKRMAPPPAGLPPRKELRP